MPAAFLPTVSALRAVAESTRLRLLAVLARGELTVTEICEVVGQSQPRISRHLKVLSDAGLLERFREQHWVYYRTPPVGEGLGTVQQLLSLLNEDDDVLSRDRRKLQDVIAERARRAAVAQTTDLPEEVDAILLRELAAEPIGVLLDVGTGSGHLLELLGAQATRAIGIDISTDALRLARTNVQSAGLAHCELQRGDMYDLPFASALFDTAVADRILARAEDPLAAIGEIARTLKRGARLMIVENFDVLDDGKTNPIATLRDWCTQAGLECGRIHPMDTEQGHLLVALARRKAAASVAA
jgi:DNA-binding transcriptional ArsR family regulator